MIHYLFFGFFVATYAHGPNPNTDTDSDSVTAEWDDINWRDVPFNVLLTDEHNSLHCTGSIISLSNNDDVGVLLTSAACSFGLSKAYIGCTSTTASTCLYNKLNNGLTLSDVEYDLSSATAIIHPDFNVSHITHGGGLTDFDWLDNDVAVILLDRAISHPRAKALPLAAMLNGNRHLQTTSYGGGPYPEFANYSLGHSDSDTLEVMGSKMLKSDECYEAFGDWFEYVYEHYYDESFDADTMHHWGHSVLGEHDFCLKDVRMENGFQTACGDAGAPVLRGLNGKGREVVGVVSWGDAYCDPNAPSVVASVPFYKEWIEQIGNFGRQNGNNGNGNGNGNNNGNGRGSNNGNNAGAHADKVDEDSDSDSEEGNNAFGPGNGNAQNAFGHGNEDLQGWSWPSFDHNDHQEVFGIGDFQGEEPDFEPGYEYGNNNNNNNKLIYGLVAVNVVIMAVNLVLACKGKRDSKGKYSRTDIVSSDDEDMDMLVLID